MLFYIERDTGHEIVGYLVPDNYTYSSRVRIMLDGETVSVFETHEERISLVTGGRHETGRCGFTIDGRDIPNLAMQSEIALYDDETGCMIYRRQKPGMITRRVVRFETQLMPYWRLDDALMPFFQYVGKGVDRYGRETVTQMMLLDTMPSSYISGRLNYKNYAYYLNNGFDCCCMVQDPHDECAERLLVLRNAAKLGPSFLGEREAKRLEPAMRFAEALPLDNPRDLRSVLSKMPEEVAGLLANPLVRMLTTANPDDMPGPSAIAGALDVLASFALVGFRDTAQEFTQAIGEWLELDARVFPVLPPFRSVSLLGEFLRETRAVDVILEKDMEFYQYALSALSQFQDMKLVQPTSIDGTASELPLRDRT